MHNNLHNKRLKPVSVSLCVCQSALFCGTYSSQTAGPIFFIVVSLERQFKDLLNRLIKYITKTNIRYNKTELLVI